MALVVLADAIIWIRVFAELQPCLFDLMADQAIGVGERGVFISSRVYQLNLVIASSLRLIVALLTSTSMVPISLHYVLILLLHISNEARARNMHRLKHHDKR